MSQGCDSMIMPDQGRSFQLDAYGPIGYIRRSHVSRPKQVPLKILRKNLLGTMLSFPRSAKWTLGVFVFVAYSFVSIDKSWEDDFRAYYQAGVHILSGANIYDRNVVEGGYLYSPFFALLMVPFGLLPQWVA